MNTRRQKPLSEDDSGVRPGHPIQGLDRLGCAEVAGKVWLDTTEQTVRSLIERGDLDGYWQRVGKVYRFWVYRTAVERFIASYGRYPGARRRLIEARKSARLRTQSKRPSASESSETAARLNSRILSLQETVRCQAVVIEKLRKVTTEQEAATNYLRQAEGASARAAKLLGEANDEYHRLVSLEGIPDDPSSAATK